VGVGDFNGDRSSDILWWNSTTGYVGYYQMNNGRTTWVGIGGVDPASSWRIIDVADFNGDRSSDILWWDGKTGNVAYFQMNNGNATWIGVGGPALDSFWRIF
jgi:hypothetical protein